MRLFLGTILFFFSSFALAWPQGTPPMDSTQTAQNQTPVIQVQGAPPAENARYAPFISVKKLVKREIKKAIDGRPYPSLDAWRPLTTREKFDTFLKHTYSPGTFAGAAVDALKSNMRDRNYEYEHGMRGIGQRMGINLATSESDVFFQRFLIPALLKQDPRYFRNPDLPFTRRVAYSVSRIVITRADNGHETFNASKIVGGSISQALADLYVPGDRQGLAPIWGRVAFNLARDAGFNLVHEFWPDLRRKFLHR
jgi:hypothetical protein